LYGVLIVAHANKRSGCVDVISEIAEKLRGLLNEAVVEYDFIRHHDRDFEGVFKKFEALGIDEIVVMPYFLFDGVHVTKTTPDIVREFSAKYPQKKIMISESLGSDKRLAEIAADRILERKKG